MPVVRYFDEHFFKQQFFYICRWSTLLLGNSTKVKLFFTIGPLDGFYPKLYCKVHM